MFAVLYFSKSKLNIEINQGLMHQGEISNNAEVFFQFESNHQLVWMKSDVIRHPTYCNYKHQSSLIIFSALILLSNSS